MTRKISRKQLVSSVYLLLHVYATRVSTTRNGRHRHFQLVEDQMQTNFGYSSYQIVASLVLGFHWMKIPNFFQRPIYHKANVDNPSDQIKKDK